jgi:GAF domain-containing protein/HAMP domain-containing protein
MFFGFFILSLIPVGVALFSIERQERETALNAQLEVMRNQARIYSGLAQAEPDKSTEIAAAMTTQTNGDIFYLIAINGTYLASSNPEQIGKPATDNFSFVTYQNITTKESTVILDEASGVIIGTYRKSRAEPLAVSVGKIENKDLTGAGIPNSIFLQIAVAFGLAFVGVWFMLSFTFNSLSNLIGYAKELSKGQLSTPFQSRIPRGEMGELASSLQVISANLQKAAVYADSKFEERNREFERRSTLLKAVADVGKAITSFRNLSELLEQTTHLIHEHFGYYHAGIFLLDEHKEYAVLSAANSEGGKRMLENKHQLKVGGIGIVGYVTQNAKARIALDVGADAVYFDNPHLPKTRSEMALPLVVGGQILGALDVQSTEPQAFSEEDISTLQILAEQLAVAIQNANLLSETEKALESARMVYGEISREAWSKILRDQPRIGFIATPPGTVQTYSETLEPNLARAFETGDIVMGSDNLTIGVPIKIRGQSIGAIRLKKSEIAEAWTQDEINLAIALSDQLTGALESARLYNESQQRGARETLVSDISARISAASHTEAILRETVQELGQTIGNVSITFQLLEHFSEQKQIEIQESEYLPGANGKVGD